MAFSIGDSAYRNRADIRRGKVGGFLRESAVSVAFSKLPVKPVSQRIGRAFSKEHGVQAGRTVAKQSRFYLGSGFIGAEALGQMAAKHFVG